MARLVLFLVKPIHSFLMKQPWNNHDTVNRYGMSVRRCFSAGMRVSICSFFLFVFSVMDSFIMSDRRVFYLALFSATFFTSQRPFNSTVSFVSLPLFNKTSFHWFIKILDISLTLLKGSMDLFLDQPCLQKEKQ